MNQLNFTIVRCSILFILFQTIATIGLGQDEGKLTADDRFELFGPAEDDFEVIRPYDVSPPASAKVNACPAAFNMNTPYNSNNGQRGCMFDVLAANAVSIRCFEVNLYAGTTGNYEIYYRAGTHVGFENNAASWTLLGTQNGVTSAGNNLPTPLNIPINVTIPAGQRYAFYITNDFGAGTSYTDGTAVGNFLANDANITVFEGVGKSYPFGLTFNVRNFNGTIFYDLGSVLNAEELSLNGQYSEKGRELNYDFPEENKFTTLELERSLTGTDFRVVTALTADQSGTYIDREQLIGDMVFYRLKGRSMDGTNQYSELLEMKLEEVDRGLQILAAFPNPCRGQATLLLESPQAGPATILISDAFGKLHQQKSIALEPGKMEVQLDFDQLPAGMYQVNIMQNGRRVIRSVAHQ